MEKKFIKNIIENPIQYYHDKHFLTELVNGFFVSNYNILDNEKILEHFFIENIYTDIDNIKFNSPYLNKINVISIKKNNINNIENHIIETKKNINNNNNCLLLFNDISILNYFVLKFFYKHTSLSKEQIKNVYLSKIKFET